LSADPTGCPEADRLEPYVLASLDREESDVLTQHLRACSACRRLRIDIEDNLKLAAVIRNATSPGETGPSDLTTASGPSPAVLGPYEILGELGRGGMGVVYEARDPKLKRLIALKVLPESLARNETRLRLFEREARILASLNHPNIATIHALEEFDGRHVITMELVRGETLAARLAGGRIEVMESLSLCRQIARGIEAAHRRDVVHRDLKPHNIAIGGAGAEAPPAPVTSPETTREPRATPGTPGYMSPEQLKGTGVDARSDIWALGCILYECLTGLRAFPGAARSERIAGTMSADPDWSALPDDVPGAIRILITRCLRKDPDERPSSMALVRREIDEAIASRSMPAGPEPGPAATPNNLPHRAASFVGRVSLIETVRAALGAGRLVTLTGPGGCGKSRLALEAARTIAPEFSAGAWLVELASLGGRSSVVEAVAGALRLKEEAGVPLRETLVTLLGRRNLLLLLDNCERHLVETAPLVEELLCSGGRITVLCTGRESLGISGETVIPVPPLDLPGEDSGANFESIEAVRLFVERSRSVSAAFTLTPENRAAVARICRQLDGLPLALELAAAWMRSMPVEEIAARLDDRFRFLTRGSRTALMRHQTLRALIDWSYDDLSERERVLFRRLATFSGGWSLASVETVCGGNGLEDRGIIDLLTSLVDKSLVEQAAAPGETRFRMLETVNRYSREHLDRSPEAREVLLRHARHFAALAEKAEPELIGPGQAEWLARLGREHGNLRGALDVLTGHSDGGREALSMAGALGRYWGIHGHWSEGRAVLESVLSLPAAAARDAARARALNWAGNLAQYQGDYDRAEERHRECLAICEAIGDRWRAASSHNNLGIVAGYRADYGAARFHHEESLKLRRELADPWAVALSTHHLGRLAALLGDIDRGRTLLEDALRRERDVGDRHIMSATLMELGAVAQAQGDFDRARTVMEEALQIAREAGDRWATATTLCRIAGLAIDRGDIELARAGLGDSLTTLRDIGDRQAAAAALAEVGHLLARQQAMASATRMFAAAASLREQIRARLSPAEENKLAATLDELVPALGRERFDAEWSRGRALDLDAAVEAALHFCTTG
jgi:predicted ATPase